VRAPILTAIAAGLALGGCRAAADRVFTPPTVALRGVRVRALGLDGGAVDVVVTVKNPNPYRLSAQRVGYRLLVDDSVEVGRGETTVAYTLDPRDSAEVRLPLDVSWRDLRAAGERALADGTVTYRVTGEIAAQTPIGMHTFPFDGHGRFVALSGGGR
jgi:LEA14-like dessication related protein